MIIATNALELGIDLAGIDIVVSLGLPRNEMNLQQQLGRAGRRGQNALMLLFYSAVNQFDMKRLLSPPNKHLLLKLDELEESVMEMHLQCIAKDDPINNERDKLWFGENIHQICQKCLDGNTQEVKKINLFFYILHIFI